MRGYGPGFKYFTHRVGHGMGLDGHEWPYLVPGNTTPVRANMMFSDEPGIYLPGEFGVRIEDDMHITADGAELFDSAQPVTRAPVRKRLTRRAGSAQVQNGKLPAIRAKFCRASPSFAV